MKGILEFDLNDFDDKMAHLRATQSTQMAIALWEIIHNTKKSIIYKVEDAINQDKNITPVDAVDMTFDAIIDILEEEGIIIDKLIN